MMYFILFSILNMVLSIKIPLTYYSDENLPFSISPTISGNFPNIGDLPGGPFASKVANMSVNPNTPFTVIFNFKEELLPEL